MTSDALTIVQFIFSSIWRLFTSWYIPGTHATPAAWFLFIAAAALSLRFISGLLSNHSLWSNDNKKDKGD